MKTWLDNLRLFILSLIIAVSPAQNLMASVDHHGMAQTGMAQTQTMQHSMDVANSVDGQPMHCQDHHCQHTQCDGVHCVSATLVIAQSPDKLVIPNIKHTFLLKYDSVLIQNFPSSLFRPPKT